MDTSVVYTSVIVVIIVFVPIYLYTARQSKNRRIQNKKLEASLEDETIIDPQTGKKYSLQEIEELFPGLEEDGAKTTAPEPLDLSNQIFLPGLSVYEERRKHLEESLLFLINTFENQLILSRPILTPTFENFPFLFNGDRYQIALLAKHIAKIMEIDPLSLQIDFFGSDSNGEQNFDPDRPDDAAGLYMGTDENGCHIIGLSTSILKDADKVIAVLAHEISHIKLLGEKHMPTNNEEFTDMTTLIFGLGLFNANVSFQFKTHSEGWISSNIGYLSQMDWGYLLALVACIKNEVSPSWANYLYSPSLKKDFFQSLEFITKNPSKVLLLQDKLELNTETQIAGNWQGITTLGPEYGKYEGHEIAFEATINQKGILISGDSKDGSGEEQHSAHFFGRFEDGTVSFIKQYTLFNKVDLENNYSDSSQIKGYVVNYKGNLIDDVLTGTWTINDHYDKKNVIIASGTWTMERKI